jgi:hypothetical protein
MSLATRDQTVLCASTTPQIEEENFQRDRADATEAPMREAEKAAEAVAERRAMATGPRIATSAASPAIMQTIVDMPPTFKRF